MDIRVSVSSRYIINDIVDTHSTFSFLQELHEELIDGHMIIAPVFYNMIKWDTIKEEDLEYLNSELDYLMRKFHGVKNPFKVVLKNE